MVLSHCDEPTIISTERLERLANTLIGTPFVWRGRTRSGLDCFGIVWWIFRSLGIHILDPVYPCCADGITTRVDRDIGFSMIDTPEPGAVLGLMLNGSSVENHVCMVISPEYVLNTNEKIGAHRLRLRSLPRNTWGGVYVHQRLIVR